MHLRANNVRRGRKDILPFLAFACFINPKQDEHQADLSLACHCCAVPRCLTLISVICKPFQCSVFKVKVSGSRCTTLSNGITQIKSDIAIKCIHRCLVGPENIFHLLFITVIVKCTFWHYFHPSIWTHPIQFLSVGRIFFLILSYYPTHITMQNVTYILSQFLRSWENTHDRKVV